MKMHSRTVLERLRRGKKGKKRIDSRRGTKSIRRCKRHPARQVFGGESCKIEVQRSALSGNGGFGWRAMNLHSTNSHTLAGGKHFKLCFFADRAGNQRACDDRAEPFHGEDAI